ncbi:transposase [Lachnospiraceae bacterium 48-33]
MEKRMEEIRQIHKESHEIYGAPKIAKKMREDGDPISEKTVGNYFCICYFNIK